MASCGIGDSGQARDTSNRDMEEFGWLGAETVSVQIWADRWTVGKCTLVARLWNEFGMTDQEQTAILQCGSFSV